MQSASIPMFGSKPGSEPAPEFHVVLLYQDFPSGLRAKEFFDRLVRGHGQAFRFLCHLWKFDLLQVPELKHRALGDAAESDMLVIAPQPSAALPPVVREWLERLADTSKRPGALVALLDDAGPTTQAIHQYLFQAAARAGMCFFSHGVPASAPGAATTTGATQLFADQSFSAPSVELRRPSPYLHCGINE